MYSTPVKISIPSLTDFCLFEYSLAVLFGPFVDKVTTEFAKVTVAFPVVEVIQKFFKGAL